MIHPETRFDSWRPIRLLVVVVLLLVGRSTLGREPNVDKKTFEAPCLIRFTGPITPRLETFFLRKLDEAKEKGADLLIIEIDSPGGYLDASLTCAERLRAITWAHTVAYVPREALSGAAITSLGCQDIIMNRGATYGDAGPIFMGEDAAFRHAPEKLRTHLARVIRDMAEKAKRPRTLCEAMVDMDLEVFKVTHNETGEVRYLSEVEFSNLGDKDKWLKGQMVIESRKSHFLEVNGKRAAELGMADAAVADRNEMYKLYGIDAAQVVVLNRNGVDTAVHILNKRWVTGVIVVIGLIALFAEISAPGMSIGGLIAGLCFAMFFWSRFLGGTAGWLEVLMFLGGIAFLVVEVFILPGFGIAGVAGLLLLLSGVVMAGQRSAIPKTPRELSEFTINVGVMIGACVAAVVGMAFLSKYLGGIPILNRLALTAPKEDIVVTGKSTEKEGGHVVPGAEEEFQVHVGDWGIAESMLRPAGKVRFDDHFIDVITEGSFIDAGQQVRVIKVTGNIVTVREIA